MKKTLKILALAISLMAVSATVIGCVSENEEKREIVSQDDKDDSQNSTNDKKSDNKNDDSSKKSNEKTTIEETVLLERDGIKITAKEYITDSFWGDGVKLLIENTSDKNLTVSCDALMVNDYMVADLLFSGNVAAGKKTNETLYLSSTELKNAGIDNVGKVEIDFYAYDDNYSRVFENEIVTLATNKIDSIDVNSNVDGVVLYNENDIKIVGQYVKDNSFWGTSVVVYVENNTEKEITVTCDNLSVNGFMVSEYFYSNVYPGKKAVDSITLFDSDLEENDIDSVEDIELSFKILNSKNYNVIDQTDPIGFSVK